MDGHYLYVQKSNIKFTKSYVVVLIDWLILYIYFISNCAIYHIATICSFTCFASDFYIFIYLLCVVGAILYYNSCTFDSFRTHVGFFVCTPYLCILTYQKYLFIGYTFVKMHLVQQVYCMHVCIS